MCLSLNRVFRGNWKCEAKGRSPVHAQALAPDAPVMPQDNFAAQPQAKPCPPDAVAFGSFAPVKMVKYLIQVVRADAQPLVFDRKYHFVAAAAQADRNIAAVWRIFQCVVQQVQDHLPKPIVIAMYWRHRPQVQTDRM